MTSSNHRTHAHELNYLPPLARSHLLATITIECASQRQEKLVLPARFPVVFRVYYYWHDTAHPPPPDDSMAWLQLVRTVVFIHSFTVSQAALCLLTATIFFVTFFHSPHVNFSSPRSKRFFSRQFHIQIQQRPWGEVEAGSCTVGAVITMLLDNWLWINVQLYSQCMKIWHHRCRQPELWQTLWEHAQRVLIEHQHNHSHTVLVQIQFST